MFWDGEAARPGLEERLALLRNPHQSLSKWDPWEQALLRDGSREWRECYAVDSEYALGPERVSNLIFATY